MGLLVYRFSDYNHTAEREQFRCLCKSLKEHYSESQETCIFIANFNIGGVELDGLIIKQDAIICVEFKNYGGEIIAAENGDWLLSDGTIIGGGSNKTVFQQAKLNRIKAGKGLMQQAGFTHEKTSKMNSIIVFNQPIVALDSSRLSPTVKSWLHIADNATFIEKVQDITDENLYLGHNDIICILQDLFLERRYLLAEYSNSEMLEPGYTPEPVKVEFNPDSDTDQQETPKPKAKRIKQKELKIVGYIDLDSINMKSRPPQKTKEEKRKIYDELKKQKKAKKEDQSLDDITRENEVQDTIDLEVTDGGVKNEIIESQSLNDAPRENEVQETTNLLDITDEGTRNEILDLSKFIKQVFEQICKGKEYVLHVYRYDDPNLKATLPNFQPNKQWFLIVQMDDALSIVDKVRRFMNREVNATSNHLTFEIGMPIETSMPVVNINLDENVNTDDSTLGLGNNTKDKKHYLKSHTTLPAWLDRLIFDKLGAIYNPDYKRHSYNLNLSEEEVLNYLGTYFPRSYAEAFCIYDELCLQPAFSNAFSSKKEINILDIGCGTGGEIIGLISALEKHIPTNVTFHIEALDGNQFSLEKYHQIMDYITKKSKRKYEINTRQVIINCTEDVENIANSYSDKRFDVIQMCKFGCELESRKICKMANPYQLLLTIFGKYLSEESVFLLLDVTTLSNTDNLFYPNLINMGVRDSLRKQAKLGTLIPICCHFYGEDCPSPCFTQKEFTVRHSKKIGDISKVAYRIIAPKSFIDKFSIHKADSQYLIKSGVKIEENTCRFSTPDAQLIDAYKLNTK